MTNQEAIKTILTERECVIRAAGGECNRDCNKCDLVMPDGDVIVAYDIAITALEKQEPMKVTEIDEEYGYYVCPSCGEKTTAIGDFLDHKHCLNCGQHLKWQEDVK